jgi:threonylcarbamoyladenosine tRNA methylthiotransferase MtaB
VETDVPRLRVSSLQPQEIDEALLECWDDKRMCPHFHLPLQSGSDAILQAMRRRYTSGRYAEAVALIRNEVEHASITADVIVGFPSETDDDFDQTYQLCETVQFADMHVFPYSIRPGTSAAHSAEQVASGVKAIRARRLLDLAKRQSVEFRKNLIGSTRSVLWETSTQEDAEDEVGQVTRSGLTEDYIRVWGKGPTARANEITLARMISLDGGLVRAEVLSSLQL